MSHVTLLKNCRGEVVSVYADATAAQAKADSFNADPFIEPGQPDPDAPYSVETWRVTAPAPEGERCWGCRKCGGA